MRSNLFLGNTNLWAKTWPIQPLWRAFQSKRGLTQQTTFHGSDKDQGGKGKFQSKFLFSSSKVYPLFSAVSSSCSTVHHSLAKDDICCQGGREISRMTASKGLPGNTTLLTWRPVRITMYQDIPWYQRHDQEKNARPVWWWLYHSETFITSCGKLDVRILQQNLPIWQHSPRRVDEIWLRQSGSSPLEASRRERCIGVWGDATHNSWSVGGWWSTIQVGGRCSSSE